MKIQHHPHFVGFETLFDAIDRIGEQKTTYPPHNLVRYDDSEDDFALELALAGYDENDIEIVYEKGSLVIQTKKDYAPDESGMHFLHKGISAKKFRKAFTLADNMEVVGARMHKGMLIVDLHKYVPEELKPKYISISNDIVKKSKSKLLTED